jgi:hypothetical protein
MKFLRSGEQQLGGGRGGRETDETYPSSHQSLVTNDFFSASSAHSFLPGKFYDDLKPDTGNIEEAELSLRESGVLNYEVACLLTYLLCAFFG